MDREKVAKNLEECIEHIRFNEFKKIPFWGNCQMAMTDALALLKEQEAVEPKTEPSAKGYWYTCGACGWWLFEVRDTVHFDYRKRIRFCASCGRSVKWE